MLKPSRAADFRRGVLDILPVLAAAAPIGLLWGTLAAARGFSPFEAWLTSATAVSYTHLDVYKRQILQRLSGKTHRVLTAVAIGFENRIELALSISEVRFRTLDEQEIRLSLIHI